MLTLHHIPPSFYSQIARLALAEKGVSYEAKITVAGPPLFETYAPWYMALNPNGTVPTLVHGEVAVPDSREIATYVDAKFPGPALTPSDADARGRMEQLVAQLYAISVRDLSYASENTPKFAVRANTMRIKNLRKRAARHPDMREIYEAKLRDIEGFRANVSDRALVEAEQAKAAAALDELDGWLGQDRDGRPFLTGASYSLADVVWTVGIARFMMIGLEPLAGRPALASWYQRMRERPSFAAAGIWEKIEPAALLAMFARELGPWLLLIVALIALVVALLWQLSSG